MSVGVGGAEQGVPFRLVGSRRFPYANIFLIVRFRSILLSEFRSVQNRSPIVQLESERRSTIAEETPAIRLLAGRESP